MIKKMKKYIILTIFSLIALTGFSQDNGITYQAVIYNPNTQSLPGIDDAMAPLVETDICLKFSIIGSGLEYEEIVQTTTDMFGMVNIKIGTNNQTGGSASSISDINWDSGEKSMRVELNAYGNCNSFVQISYQSFSYVPFAYYAHNDANTAEIEENSQAIDALQADVDQNESDSDAADQALQDAIDAFEAATVTELNDLSDAKRDGSNIGVGLNALANHSDGNYNNAFGNDALANYDAGGFNVAAGTNAMKNYQSGEQSVAIGFGAMENAGGMYNVAVGMYALKSMSGSHNTGVGMLAGTHGTEALGGSRNTIIGSHAEFSSQNPNNQTVIGSYAKSVDNNSVTLGNSDVNAVYMADDGNANVYAGGIMFSDGTSMMSAPDTGNSVTELNDLSDAVTNPENIGVGSNSLSSLTNGNYNTAIGINTLSQNTDANENTAVGAGALSNKVGGNDNTALGAFALINHIDGHSNTALGRATLTANISGEYNTAVGGDAMFYNTSGERNTALGRGALLGNTIGNFNVAVGMDAGRNIISGSNNIIVGNEADPSSPNANNQIVIGYGATGMEDNSVVLGNADVTDIYMSENSGAIVHAAGITFSDGTTISSATSAGASELNDLSDVEVGGNNLLMGTSSYASLATGATNNTAIGVDALPAISTGDKNVAVGNNALLVAAGGLNNVAVGFNAAKKITSGSYNIAIGASSSQHVIGGNSNISIGNNTGPGSGQGGATNRISIGSSVTNNINHTAIIGNAATTEIWMAQDKEAMLFGQDANFSGNITVGAVYTLSDKKFKSNIEILENTISNLSKLRGKKYFNSKIDKNDIGLIAQEVQQIYPNLVSEFTDENNDKVLAVNYQGFVPILINAINEQQDIIDEQQEKLAEIDELRQEIETLKQLILNQ